MSTTFKALLAQLEHGKITPRLTSVRRDQLPAGDVLIKVEYSSLNYKDALGLTGQSKIYRSLPMVGGIDLAGHVVESNTSEVKTGDAVLVTGCNLGEEFWGGYSEYACVPRETVIPLPVGLSPHESMILGTAGFTAALCLWRMLQNSQSPSQGPIAVTGATGGVGSFALQIFSAAGFEPWAITSRPQHNDRLKHFGASQCSSVEELKLGSKPLESINFGGAVDNVGGELLARLYAHTALWGNIACVGLAASAELHTTVMPLILRGVSLLGISSNNCPLSTRKEIWKKLAKEWKPRHLAEIHTETIGLEEVLPTASLLLERKLTGRIVVKI